ncbi:carbohydrate binding domain-containing protein [Yeosuana sp. AK3]
MKKFIKIAKNLFILVLVLSLTGCEDNDNNNFPIIEAGFTHTINQDTGTVTFINISTQATNYIWDFGDETNSTLINPVKTYPNGTYTVVLKASNVAGASDTFEDIITISIPEIATLPISFDGQNTSYDAVTFGGTSFGIVANPDPSGTNAVASNVGEITNIGAPFEGFYFDLGEDINLTTEKSISINFWSNTPVSVLVKLEEGTAAATEASASHGGTGWETLVFNFSASASYSRLTIFVDGPGTTAGTFYIDDIIQIETPALPCEAETSESYSAADLNMTFLTDPSADFISDGAGFSWVNNPDFENDVNKSCKVAQVVKSGQFPWDNNQYDLDGKLDFNANTGLKIKVWSGRANTEVRLKLEEIGNPANNVEKFLTTSVTSGWEELTFPFSAADSDKFNKIVIFFDLNASNTDTYYFDDLKLYFDGNTGGGTCEAETTESYNAADLNMTFLTDPSADFISDGAGFSWINNPDFDNNVNKSCKVAQVVKSGQFPWDNNQYDLDAKLDFNTNTGLKIKVWSARANTEVRLKLEEIGNAANNVEKFLTTSVTSGWEELTFPFSAADSGKFNKIVIFFDLNANNTDTYYFDDLVLYGDGSTTGGGGGTGGGTITGIAFNTDFETGTDSGWIRFQNGGVAVFDNTINNGGSWSGRLETNGASNPAFKQEAIGIGAVAAGNTITIAFDHIGSMGGEGGVFNVLLFGEGANGASFTHVFNPTPALAETWSRFSGSFTIPGGTDVSGGISFLIETVCGGAPGCTVTANIDNVSVTVN